MIISDKNGICKSSHVLLNKNRKRGYCKIASKMHKVVVYCPVPAQNGSFASTSKKLVKN